MSNEKKVAIIGMAGRFPDATNLEALRQNLIKGRCSLQPISAERIARTTLSPDRSYQVRGYMQDIDLFDHKLFNIPLSEAQCMDPHQRILLEVVHESIEQAGYSTSAFQGSNTSVFVAHKDLDYYEHADAFNPLLINGNGAEFLAARISRAFNLAGGVAVIDTSCSSSLVALHHACNELLLGDADQALVCGVSLELFPYQEQAYSLEVESPDGWSIPFSDRSNGMTYGESAISILIKPLERAIADKDYIHAVICGTAVNNNGNRSAGLNAPDSVAQADVIEKAWRKAGINPLELGFIEAHGSGTVLGDSIEVGGLNLAFARYGAPLQTCPISTIKANIGHTRCVAGLAGLVKVALALRHKEIYPAYYTGNSSQYIQFSQSAVYIHTDYRSWEKNNGSPRIAAVSSMGFSGTNGHVVLQEAPTTAPTETTGPYIFPVSSQTAEGLRRNLQALLAAFEPMAAPALPDVSFTLAKGRKAFAHRVAFVAEDFPELLDAIRSAIAQSERIPAPLRTDAKVLLLLGDHQALTEAVLEAWGRAFAPFSAAAADCESQRKTTGLERGAAYYNFTFQYAFAALLKAKGLTAFQVLGVGGGRALAACLADQLPLEAALLESVSQYGAPVADLASRVANLVARETAAQPVLFLALGGSNALTQALHAHPARGQQFFIWENEATAVGPSFLQLYKALFQYLPSQDFSTCLDHLPGSRIPLPGYQFERIRCWIRERPKVLATVDAPQSQLSAAWASRLNPVERIVADIWSQVLEREITDPQTHFFDVGGESLKATKVINRLQASTGIQLDFEDLFDYPILGELAGLVEKSLDTETRLRLIWQEVLKSEHIAPEEDFFEIGGHSLLANQILNRMRNWMGVHLNFEDFYQLPTIRQMAKHLDGLQVAQAPESIKPVPEQRYYALSNNQKRLWLLCQMEDGGIAYNEVNAYQLDGALDPSLLEQAFCALVERHEALRTIFVPVNDEPTQCIIPAASFGFSMPLEDLSSHVEVETATKKAVDAFLSVVIDLSQGPLFRAKLLRLADQRHILLIHAHHIIFDDWSFEVLIRELAVLYDRFRAGGPNPLPTLAIQYKDYAAWNNERLQPRSLQPHLDFWLQQFSGELPVLELPYDFQRPTHRTHQGSSVAYWLGPELTRRLRTFCQAEKASVFMGLITALNALFYRYTHQQDIVLGIPVAGRDHFDLEGQIGFYANTLALRTQFTGEQTFRALLETVRLNLLSAQAHQCMPFDGLVDHLQVKVDPSRNPLFDVLVVYKKEDTSEYHKHIGGVKIDPYFKEVTTSKFDLNFAFIEEPEDLAVTIVYNTQLFRRDSMERLFRHLCHLLSEAIAAPAQRISAFHFLSAAEQQQLVRQFSWGTAEAEQTVKIQELFEGWVKETPNAPALVSETAQMSYAVLNEKANQIAWHLRQKSGIQTGDCVAIVYERSFEMLISILGVLKAGATYVPILASYPDERINFMLQDAGVKALLIDNERFLQKYQLVDCLRVFVSEVLAHPESALNGLIGLDYPPSPIASVLYTSGSTGKPKGVRIEHPGLVSRIQWMRHTFGIGPNDVMLQRTNYVFDVSILEIFAALCGGSRLVMIKDDDLGDIAKTIEAIKRFGVTNMQTTPSEYTTFLDKLAEGSPNQLPSLKYVFSAGEALLPQLVKKHYSKLSAPLWNLYGPTEASVIVSYYETKAADAVTPIGRPLPGVQLQVLDKNLQLLPIGVWGEICISGLGMAKGYLNREETTRERFLDNPHAMGENSQKLYKTGDIGRWTPEGQIEFLGRRDFQLKINGYRVELGEIENNILKNEGVSEVAVVVTQKEPEVQVVAFITRSKDAGEDNMVTLGADDDFSSDGPDATAGISNDEWLLLRQFNQTDCPFPADRNCFELFELAAHAHPEAGAIEYRQERLTYRALYERVDRLAAYLQAKGLKIGDMVPVCCGRSTDLVVSMLALFKIGGVYVPLSTEWPAQRVQGILEDCRANFFLTNTTWWESGENRAVRAVAADWTPNCCCVDECWKDAAPYDSAAISVKPQDLAYVIFTSGSTGKPKGVMIEQVGMVNHLYAKINSLRMDHNSRVIQNASQSFDISIWQMLAALLTGGTTIIYDDDLVLDPEQFVLRLAADRPTILEVVPSYLAALLDVFDEQSQLDIPDSLQYLMVTGETLKPTLVKRWFDHFANCPMVNAYGPTEASDDITHCFIHELPADGRIPIGKPVQNMRIYILDAQQRLCPIGVKGEICVAGIGVGRGYLNQPEKTAAVFMEDPFRTEKGVRLYKTGDLGAYLPDGSIAFYGRKDHQHKINGFRVELGEIEHALLRVDGVLDAVVAVKGEQANPHRQYLCAYVQVHEKSELRRDDIRAQLVALLPPYMVPNFILFLDTFPLTDNGKIDRKALPNPLSDQKNRELEAYLLKKLLRELPAHMIPSAFVTLEKMPRTATGKVDRKVLESMKTTKQSESEFHLPQTPTEAALLEIWAKVLQRNRISTKDNFFDIGGHSLKSGRIVTGIQQKIGVKISIRDVFTFPTIEELAKVIDQGQQEWSDPIPALYDQPHYEPSYAQRRMWMLSRLVASSAVYNIAGACTVIGELQPSALQTAVNRLLARHENLRTVFFEQDGQPFMQILPIAKAQVLIDYQDLGALSDAETLALEYASQESQHVFDLARAPLMRITLLRLGPNRHALILVIHHILADGWSLDLMINELFVWYKACRTGSEAALPKLNIQYRDFAAWQNQQLKGAPLKAHRQYWLDQFAGTIPVLNLPTDQPRGHFKTYRGGNVSLQLGEAETRELERWSSSQGTTLFMSLFAAVTALLYRYSNQEDIVIGTPVAGRNHPDLENQIGLFINTLALRTRFSGQQSFGTLLETVKANVLDAFDHQDYPLDDLIDQLPLDRDVTRSPLFDVMVVLHNTDMQKKALPTAEGLLLESLEFQTPLSKFDLSFHFSPTAEGLSLGLNYNTDLFHPTTAGYLLRHLKQLLWEVMAQPSLPLNQLVLKDQAEQQLLAQYETGQRMELSEVETYVSLFEQTAKAHPTSIALVFEGRSITYAELDHRATRLAHWLERHYHIDPGAVVALRLQRSDRLIVAMLAAMKTGAAYLPLDVHQPIERACWMLSDSQAQVLIVDSETAFEQSIAPCWVFQDEHLLPDGPQGRANIAMPGHAAYLIYTSGSTGQPKGVSISQIGLANYAKWFIQAHQLGREDQTVLLSSVAFDLCYTSLWPTLAAGASIQLPRENAYLDVVGLLDLLANAPVSFLKMTPSHFYLLVHDEAFPSLAAQFALRLVVLGGEKIRPDDLSLFYAHARTETVILNHYGPTETTIGVITQPIVYQPTAETPVQEPCLGHLSLPSNPVIGRPIANHQAFIVGPSGVLQGVGLVGELLISGPGLALGYLNNPALTADRFVPHPTDPGRKAYRTGDLAHWLPDGRIAFLGRSDHQVKLRGYRIELGEVEHAIRQFEGIAQSIVVLQTDAQGFNQLIAYVQGAVSSTSLQQHLRERLPAYMVPSHIVLLPALPLTANGKIDRARLPEWDNRLSDPADIQPAGEKAALLCRLTARLFGRESVSATDDFFQLGGDSIRAIQLVSRLYHEGFKLEVRDIFQQPVLATLAEKMSPVKVVAEQGPIKGTSALTPIQADFFKRPLKYPHHYNQSVLLYSSQPLNEAMLRRVFSKLAQHHDVLRSSFAPDVQGNIVQTYEDIRLSPNIQVHDLRGRANAGQLRENLCQSLQGSFQLDKAPLAAVALFKEEDGDRLLFALHHLVTDGISWRILLEDLNTLHQQVTQGLALQLPLKTDAYKTWGETLAQYAQLPAFEKEMLRWRLLLAQGADAFGGSETGMTGIGQQQFVLDEPQTNLLLGPVHRAYTTEINDVLLAALSLALYRLAGIHRVAISLEGHGREEIMPEVNISRTVGWFTCHFPVVLDAGNGTEAAAIIATKDRLHKIPNRGIGYGICQHYRPDIFQTLPAVAPMIRFNYLGQFEAEAGAQALVVSDEAMGHPIHPEEALATPIAVSALVASQRLQVQFLFDRARFTDAFMHQLALQYQHCLAAIIQHCAQSDGTILTSSDLGYQELTMEELRNFFQ